ncbi:MAG: histidine phosphatase family protein [Pseudomonadota bacterium]
MLSYVSRQIRVAALASLCIAPTTAFADTDTSVAEQFSRIGDGGEMTMPQEMGSFGISVTERLTFEPFQMAGDLQRNDIVLLMRHGPTDWSVRDERAVASTNCAGQRVMSEVGQAQMRALGVLMGLADVMPGEIVVSEWCRNQQTLAALMDGFGIVDATFPETVPVTTEPYANLLLSIGGAENVTELRERVLSWEGSEDGPLLIVTHFTNIQELTEFSVYEGEMLVLDPTLNGRVLGYLRLASSRPDIGHFDDSVATE